MVTIPLHVVVAGSRPFTTKQLQTVLDGVNKIYGGIVVTCPRGNFVDNLPQHQRNTLVMMDDAAHKRRRAYCREHLGTLCVFLWDIDGGGAGHSRFYLLTGKDSTQAGINLFAHELGHVLCLHHTHREYLFDELRPAEPGVGTTLRAEFQKYLKENPDLATAKDLDTQAKAWCAKQLDGDCLATGVVFPVEDTPYTFHEIHGYTTDEFTKEGFTVVVDLGNVPGQMAPLKVSLVPDQHNVMSYYWLHPHLAQRLTAGQIQLVNHSVREGCHRHVIDGFQSSNADQQRNPRLTSDGPGQLYLFVVDDAGTVLHKRYANSAWGPGQLGWYHLGGDATATPTAVARTLGSVDLMVRWRDGTIRSKVGAGQRWWPGVREWHNLGGDTLASPAAIGWGKARLDVFATFTDGSVRNRHWSPMRGDWTKDWSSLGGAHAIGTPVPVATEFGHLDLFVRRTNDSVWWRQMSKWQWAPEWVDLGGQGVGPVAASSWGPGHVDVVGVFPDGSVRNKVRNGSAWWPSQQGWQTLDARVTNNSGQVDDLLAEGYPALVSPEVGKLLLFVTGIAHHERRLWRNLWSADVQKWSGWAQAGNDAWASPTAVAWGPAHVDIAVRSEDGRVRNLVSDYQSVSGMFQLDCTFPRPVRISK